VSSTALAYLDTSAFVKLAVPEPETAALQRELPAYGEPFASDLLAIEARRVGGRLGSDAAASLERLLADVSLVSISPRVRDLAATVPPTALRSLDAIHLATAVLAGIEQTTLLTYDTHLTDAARLAGLRVEAPS
jgi:predicted nucleic acid-binding protein